MINFKLVHNNNDGWSGVFFEVGMILDNWYCEKNLEDKDKLTILRIMGWNKLNNSLIRLIKIISRAQVVEDIKLMMEVRSDKVMGKKEVK